MIEFIELAKQCAPMVNVQTMTAFVRTESGFNPFAIGINGGAARLNRQPLSYEEAVMIGRKLDEQGYDWDAGYGQVNRRNFGRFGLTVESVFLPCTNLRVSALIVEDCYKRALPRFGSKQQALRGAMSCYNTGNFAKGFLSNKGRTSYVDKVVGNAVGPGVRGAMPAVRMVAAPKERAPMRPPASESSHLVRTPPNESVDQANAASTALVF